MAAKRYGPVDGKSRPGLADYHQSKDELAGLPVVEDESRGCGGGDVPEAGGVVGPARQEGLAVRAQGHGLDLTPVAQQ